jgi:hypothetical protein
MALIRNLALLAFALLFTQMAAAQILAGTYEITDLNNQPIVPGATAITVVQRDGSGNLVSKDTIDFHDGNGPQAMPDEATTFYQTDRFGLEYSWVNARGTVGVLYFDWGRGKWVSIVMTGPNEGHESSLRRM